MKMTTTICLRLTKATAKVSNHSSRLAFRETKALDSSLEWSSYWLLQKAVILLCRNQHKPQPAVILVSHGMTTEEPFKAQTNSLTNHLRQLSSF